MRKIILSSFLLLLSIGARSEFKNFSVKDMDLVNEVLDTSAWGVAGKEDFSGDVFEDNPIFKKIMEEYQKSFAEIGRRQADGIQNGNSYIGGLNNIGWKYAKAYGTFLLSFNRQVAPALFSDTIWLVTDEMTVEIEASHIIKKLKNEGAIDLSEQQLAAFGGIVFKRVYRYSHFANSYIEGLSSHLEYLFFPFKFFKVSHLFKMNPFEYVRKEDYLGVKVGALGSIPVGHGASLAMGAIIQFEQIATVDIQSVGEGDRLLPNDAIKISFEKQKGKSSVSSASFQIDFLHLLQLTLLRHDFEYSYVDSDKIYLSMTSSDLLRADKDEVIKGELQRLLALKKYDREKLNPYLISREQRREEIKKSRYLAFIWAGTMESATEQVEIVKDGQVKKFFQHHFRRIRYRENLISKFWNAIVGRFLGISPAIKKDFFLEQKFSFEYESQDDLLESKKDYDIKNGKISFLLENNIQAASTTGRKNRRAKNMIMNLMNEFTELDFRVKELVENGYVQKEIDVSSKFNIGRLGLLNFLQRNIHDNFRLFQELCRNRSGQVTSGVRSDFGLCRQRTYGQYQRFLNEWHHQDYSRNTYDYCEKKASRFFWNHRKKSKVLAKCLANISLLVEGDLTRVPLWRLGGILKNLLYYAKNERQLMQVYGEDNIFGLGYLKGKSRHGELFRHYYKKGIFRGEGVINEQRTAHGLRIPASIEQW